ncbi:MAG: hybrid sensor histidine kinase/response regulator [Bacteroidota bacterium]
MKNQYIKNPHTLILIVDDEPKNLQVLGTILMEQKYKVVGAKSGKNALNAIKRTVPDLILLDVMMPEMDGYETCTCIKENENLKDVPVIFLTAKVEPEDIVKGFDVGGVDYITKPFNHAELLARISTHLALKRSNDALKNTEQELRIANTAKDKFFSIIAHDLKSPFNALFGFSELLYENFDEYDTEEQKEFISHVHQGLKNTYKLLEDLLLWSRAQSGTIDFNPEKLNLFMLILETMGLLGQAASEKSIDLKNEIAENVIVEADKNMLATILRNLISNAIKFTPKNGAITINARLMIIEKAQSYAEISIKDNGVGIAKEKLSQLFEISKNVSTKGTENEDGTGLGLMLCKELIEKHTGKIWVKSEVGIGSEFIFSLPLGSL